MLDIENWKRRNEERGKRSLCLHWPQDRHETNRTHYIKLTVLVRDHGINMDDSSDERNPGFKVAYI